MRPIDELVNRLVANPIVERWAHGTVDLNPPTVDAAVGTAEVIAVRGLDDDALARGRSFPFACPSTRPNCTSSAITSR